MGATEIDPQPLRTGAIIQAASAFPPPFAPCSSGGLLVLLEVKEEDFGVRSGLEFPSLLAVRLQSNHRASLGISSEPVHRDEAAPRTVGGGVD